MRNLKITLAYDGTEFSGWQVQPGLETIQGTLASAIGRLTGEKVLPQGSGRTDAGVHALAQVASFATESAIPVENWQKALNDILPTSIRVLGVTEAAAEFHARKSARGKTYRYRMYRGAVCPPFLARYVWHYPYPLDEAAMAEAAGVVVGEHDFTSFAAVDAEKDKGLNHPFDSPSSCSGSLRTGSGHEGTRRNSDRDDIRTIFSSAWVRDGDEFVYTVRGSGFLHHMVRNLVGTFLLVGKGTLGVPDVERIMESHDRSAAGATAPAGGLYLVEVLY
jgi:tRNA pseudouridine38-40 synthase